ncbi:MAG TPA: type II secretion system protein GspG [Pirellulaceae bacterium]|nr:type II secretion system protein GspG [Pirellulaceae bacterium]
MSPDRKPFQFSVRQLLAVFLALCVALALVTQLWHVGFVLALLLGGIAAGAWRRDWRLTAAASTALLIFVTTYAASWLQWGESSLHSEQPLIRMQLDSIDRQLQEHFQRYGQIPASLDDVPALAGTTDIWGHPFHYRKVADVSGAYELASLGRDGKPGGVGLDADFSLAAFASDLGKRVTLWQFTFETNASAPIFIGATTASLVAAGIWYSAQRQERPVVQRMILSLVVTTIAAVIVSVFLAGVHVVLSQSSGH